MQINVVAADPLKHPCQALVVGRREDGGEFPWFYELDKALGGCLGRLAEEREFTGKLNSYKLIHTLGRLPAERVLLVGVGKERELTPDRLRQAAGTAAKVLRQAGVRSCSSLLHQTGGAESGLKAAVEGLLLGSYGFEQYKTDPAEGASLAEATILCATSGEAGQAEQTVGEARIVCDAVALARDLVSQPPNVATPEYLAEQARTLAAHHGIVCRVLDQENMESLGMEALLAVARGSRQAPRFIILEYMAGAARTRPTVLVGKGVTFDSGGISLKPSSGMEKMKDDMAGAATVMATLQAAAALKLPVNLVGLIPAVENLPDGRACKPGDIVRSMAGTTIEIINTDAEGRLILCDALHYAKRYRPAALIDIATLTGACVVALGHVASALMGNDAGLKRVIRKAAETTGEKIWEMPLWEEYGELMQSDIADLKNAGGPHAGAISAGWFLQKFVGKTKWAHLDIAGTAWEEKGRPYQPKGATGVGVRLLVECLRGLGVRQAPG